MCTICFNISNSVCHPHSPFMGYILFLEWTAEVFLNIIKDLTFVMVMQCVFVEVGTKFLNYYFDEICPWANRMPV
jgi:hypothetical protein